MSASTLARTTVYFAESLIDVVRIRFNLKRVISDSVLTAQFELLGCAEGKNEYEI